MNRIDAESETLIAHYLRAEGHDASEDGTGRGTPLVVAFAQNSRDEVRLQAGDGSIVGALAAEAGMKQQTYVAFSCKDHGADAGDVAPTLRSMGHSESHANGGGQVAVAFNLRGRDGGAMPEVSDVASLRAASGESSRSYIASTLKSNHGGGGFGSDPNETFIPSGMAVRRLTPTECERLQGFPDGYTAIPGAADGPRYKALGNSMAVPVMAWIGRRIQQVK